MECERDYRDPMAIDCKECQGPCKYSNQLEQAKTSTPEIAHERRQRIRQTRETIGAAGYELGLLLTDAYKAKDFKVLGYHEPGETDYKAFVRMCEAEYGLQKSQVANLMAIVEKFGPYVDKEALGHPTRLTKLLPRITGETTPEEIKDMLANVKSLSASQFEDYVKELKGKQAQDTCDHEDQTEILTVVCGKCGKALSRTEG